MNQTRDAVSRSEPADRWYSEFWCAASTRVSRRFQRGMVEALRGIEVGQVWRAGQGATLTADRARHRSGKHDLSVSF